MHIGLKKIASVNIFNIRCVFKKPLQSHNYLGYIREIAEIRLKTKLKIC